MKRSPMKRGEAMKRSGTVLKRSRIAPKSAKRKAEVPSPEELAGREAWHRATVADSRCACCGKRSADPHGHHVVLARHVRAKGGNVWDLRNRLTLAHDCHLNHHHGGDRQRIPQSALRPENVEFVRELLGEDAQAYLDRHYPAH